MTLWGWLRQARRAARELRAHGRGLPLAEAFLLDRPTQELLEALEGLGIFEREDLGRVPRSGPLVNVA